jgi:hypothetical protein
MRLRRGLHSIIRRFWPPEPKPLILMYHRIAEEPNDPWALAVAPARFEEQLLVLRRTRHLLPLMDFIRHLKAGSLPAHSAAVTFDDGYADNLSIAAPILRKHHLPATLFIATGYLDGGCMWNDKVIEAFRSTQDPRLFYIHSRWIDEAAFETHGGMPHTVRFLKQVEPLLDQPFDAARTVPLE